MIPPQVDLRSFIDQLIRDRGGWHIKMEHEGGHLGATTYIEDTEINSPAFLKALLEKNPNLSYGSHTWSEVGEAFRFGVIDNAVNWAMRAYQGWPSSSKRLKFLKALMIHNLLRLNESLKSQALPRDSLSSFREKESNLLNWINILDIDLELREKWGRSFSDAPEPILKEVFRRRNDPEALRQFLMGLVPTLPRSYEEQDVTSLSFTESFASMTPVELDEFVAKNKGLFSQDFLQTFYANHAIARWAVVKDERAKHEGLGRRLTTSLDLLEKQIANGRKPGENTNLFTTLEPFLNTESNRLNTVLAILQTPEFKKYLTDYYQFEFTSDGPNTLEDVLYAHPQTRLIFEPSQFSLSSEDQVAIEFLNTLGGDYQVTIDKDNIKSFEQARSLSGWLRSSRRRLQEDLEDVRRPMNSARSLEEMKVGEKLSFYQRLKRDYKAASDLWKDLGLEQEFRQHFPDEELFWKSDLSLWEIYNTLRANQELK